MDLMKLFQQPGAVKNVRANPSGSAFAFQFGNWVMLPENYTTYIDNGFKNIPYVYAIVDQIAEKFSDAPRELMQVIDKQKARGYDAMTRGAKSPKDFFLAATLRKKAMRTMDYDHPYYKLMEAPNPITPTEKTFNYMRCGYLALTGNSYTFDLIPGAGQYPDAPKQLMIIPSPTCAPVVGSLYDPIQAYRVSYFDEDLPKERVQHVKLSNFTSSSHDITETLVGMSPMRSLIPTNSQLRDAENANGLAFANMAPAGIINGDGMGSSDSLTEDQGVQIQEGFVKRHLGAESWKKIIVTPAKVNWTQIGFSPVDMDILAFMDKAEERIAKVYHYPLGLLNSQGEVANETINSRRMITDAVLPYIRRFDDADTQAVKRWYKDPNLRVVTDLQYFPELQEDMTRVVQWLKDAYWLTVEEKREVMDYQAAFEGTMLVPSSLETYENIVSKLDLSGGDNFNEL
jgi:phage portal protein BeeE